MPIEDRTRRLRELLVRLWDEHTSIGKLAIEEQIVNLFDAVQNEARREVFDLEKRLERTKFQLETLVNISDQDTLDEAREECGLEAE